jgi:hypothetical protein
MTVAELIKRLAHFDPDTPVVLYEEVPESNYYDATSVDFVEPGPARRGDPASYAASKLSRAVVMIT